MVRRVLKIKEWLRRENGRNHLLGSIEAIRRKWVESGLLDSLKGMSEDRKNNIAQLLESQASVMLKGVSKEEEHGKRI